MHRKPDRIDAFGPSQQRQRHDLRAGRSLASAVGAVIGDLAAELVTEHDRLLGPSEAVVADLRRELGPRIAAMAGMQIRSADSAAQHLNPYLAGAGHRLGALDDLELSPRAGNGSHRAGRVSEDPVTRGILADSRSVVSSAGNRQHQVVAHGCDLGRVQGVDQANSQRFTLGAVVVLRASLALVLLATRLEGNYG